MLLEQLLIQPLGGRVAWQNHLMAFVGFLEPVLQGSKGQVEFVCYVLQRLAASLMRFA
ncbi:MAG: hypothetical protein FD135_4672 [Comamonadaceae bacterium]|nr:MAG: hypothetical protein FD135_4672 [Comamonadaceae bacterium]